MNVSRCGGSIRVQIDQLRIARFMSDVVIMNVKIFGDTKFPASAVVSRVVRNEDVANVTARR